MTTQKVFKTLRQVFSVNPALSPNQGIAQNICATLKHSELKSLKSKNLLSDLNSDIIHLVLSNPDLKIQSCLYFFKFLQRNQTLCSYKPDLQAYVILVCRLLTARKFAEAKIMLNSVVVDNNLRSPVSVIADLVDEYDYGKRISPKLLDMLFRIYADNELFNESLEVFDYMKNNGVELDERSCMVFLRALKRGNNVEMLVNFFWQMVDSGVQITVYAMSVVVDVLCKIGDVRKARRLIDEMGARGVKPNVFTYNSLLDACIRKRNMMDGKEVAMVGIDEILGLMESNGVLHNVATYTLLIEWFYGIGKIKEAERLFKEMCEKGIKVDVYAYTTVINWNCRLEKLKRAFELFDEMTEKGLTPTIQTYGALINGVCKGGQMEAAEILVKEMQNKGIEINLVIINTLVDGYCKKGMIDEALKLQNVMENKGIAADVFFYSSISNGLCKLKRHDEAKKLLFTMEEKGVAPNAVTFTALVDIYCKEGDISAAKSVFREMERKGEHPNTVTYNALIDGFVRKGRMKEARKLIDEMECMKLMPDVYTYTSIIHGECIIGNVDEALKLFGEMSIKGLIPTVVTYTALISGLSKRGRSEEAFKLYDEMIEAGLTPDDSVYSSLVGSLHPTAA